MAVGNRGRFQWVGLGEWGRRGWGGSPSGGGVVAGVWGALGSWVRSGWGEWVSLVGGLRGEGGLRGGGSPSPGGGAGSRSCRRERWVAVKGCGRREV
ncbi:hypothetical protein TIFTF001_001785 [Ficus carica]|uniref:Uncharacterized protein n=1 Tax=Ficus carica TaxID=3494 RepID=A0AA87Z834_FICCA|nr:hypothetical protein TIFTF001_001785 [Ficus carica]